MGQFLVLGFFTFQILAENPTWILDGIEKNPSSHPEILNLSIEGEKCTQTIVGPRAILTAAHCLKHVKNQEKVTFFLKGEIVAGTVHKHQRFVAPGNSPFDIALIVLEEALRSLKSL